MTTTMTPRDPAPKPARCPYCDQLAVVPLRYPSLNGPVADPEWRRCRACDAIVHRGALRAATLEVVAAVICLLAVLAIAFFV